MKEVVLILFVFISIVGGVHAEGEWGDINDGEVLARQGGVSSYAVDVMQLSADGEKWTQDFYIALGVGGLGLLIVVLFVYFFLRGPKNKWKK